MNLNKNVIYIVGTGVFFWIIFTDKIGWYSKLNPSYIGKYNSMSHIFCGHFVFVINATRGGPKKLCPGLFRRVYMCTIRIQKGTLVASILIYPTKVTFPLHIPVKCKGYFSFNLKFYYLKFFDDICITIFTNNNMIINTAKSGQPAIEVEQAPVTPLNSKNKFSVLTPQWGTFREEQILHFDLNQKVNTYHLHEHVVNLFHESDNLAGALIVFAVGPHQTYGRHHRRQ